MRSGYNGVKNSVDKESSGKGPKGMSKHVVQNVVNGADKAEVKITEACGTNRTK